MNRLFGSFSPIFDSGTLYLSFLQFESDELPQAFSLVWEMSRTAADAVPDLRRFLAESGWREQLVTCAVMLARREIAGQLLDEVWGALDRGSWVSPQLAVTAYLCDPQFETKARERITRLCPQDTEALRQMPALERHVFAGTATNSGRASKALSALVYLAGLSAGSRDWLDAQIARGEIKALLDGDQDGGGEIAKQWLTEVRARSQALGLELA